MKRIGLVLLVFVFGVLTACAPSTERVLGGGSSTYLLQRGLFERQADFIIKDAGSGFNMYRVEPPVLSLREALVITDVQGRTLGRIVRKVLVLTPTFEIYRDGALVATLGQNVSDLLANVLIGDRVGDRFTVAAADGSPGFEIRGRVFDLNYDIYRQGQRVAHVSKAPFARNYFVEVAPGEDNVLMLGMVIALNELTAAQKAR